jgi:hypothetical protein
LRGGRGAALAATAGSGHRDNDCCRTQAEKQQCVVGFFLRMLHTRRSPGASGLSLAAKALETIKADVSKVAAIVRIEIFINGSFCCSCNQARIK